MIIKNIYIKDFRNVTYADVNFGNINIITGKNSSGKSNFLLALANSLSLKRDYNEVFSENIVTFQKGKNHAVFRTTIGNIDDKVIYQTEKGFFYVSPNEFVFEKSIDKKTSSSKYHKLFFSGKTSEIEIKKDTKGIAFPNEAFKKLQSTANDVQNLEVFNRNFKEEIDENGRIVEFNENISKNQEKYYRIFHDFYYNVVSYSGLKSGWIYDYVADRYNNEIYEQAIKRIKSKDGQRGSRKDSYFKDSKFIFLLADIQRDKKIRDEFKHDLNIYTKGILKDVHVNTVGKFGTKGDIIIDSPNGPKEIHSISTGTAVLLFFVALKNWMNLKRSQRNFVAPNIMIFDEVDSFLHPTVVPEFVELLRALSNSIQIFIATHSPYFIDYFNKKELYLIRDGYDSLGRDSCNRSNIFSYQELLNKIPKGKNSLINKKNSELLIDGLIDLILP